MEPSHINHHESQNHTASSNAWVETMNTLLDSSAQDTTQPSSEFAPHTEHTESPSAAERTELALNAITRWRDRYDDEEADFIHLARRANLADPASRQQYLNWLSRSEQSASFSWQQMIQSTNDALNQRVISGAYQTAQAQDYGRNIDPTKSIEAASAIFFDDRMDNIRDCINNDASLTDEERKKRLFLLRNTWHRVEDYILTTSDLYSGYDGQRARRNAHNNMIKQLNTINDLARHYDTTPLTFRNFMTNDFPYNRSLDRNGALDHKAEYDRETVATYFFNAFAGELNRIQAKQAASTRLFR